VTLLHISFTIASLFLPPQLLKRRWYQKTWMTRSADYTWNRFDIFSRLYRAAQIHKLLPNYQ